MIAASPVLGPGPAALNMTLPDPPSAATSRKRSRSMIFQEDGEQEEQCWDRTSNGSGQGSTDDLKRTRTTGELDALGVIPTGEAWQLQGIATDLLTAADSTNGLNHYVAGRSLIVLCVLEHMDVHYRLLWYD
ncbi:uba3-binding protein but1 o42666 [Neofusicoccum parvum]|uniref:Uncharacterized protein n=2 Tax=Neofusicoccum parvum TaxID=310453 RepID=R1ED58_BOTPV|nr:hypothetical protein UCRNP2_7564 [Neofusicoccum parvum UCRNP2]GME32659.1 uba3-binding protein but1 o42666 [Neofusicoccum parvum]GME62855.1 uba3-binding protein but1 o42666 [Neofusicoccum parvum]